MGKAKVIEDTDRAASDRAALDRMMEQHKLSIMELKMERERALAAAGDNTEELRGKLENLREVLLPVHDFFEALKGVKSLASLLATSGSLLATSSKRSLPCPSHGPFFGWKLIGGDTYWKDQRGLARVNALEDMSDLYLLKVFVYSDSSRELDTKYHDDWWGAIRCNHVKPVEAFRLPDLQPAARTTFEGRYELGTEMLFTSNTPYGEDAGCFMFADRERLLYVVDQAFRPRD